MKLAAGKAVDEARRAARTKGTDIPQVAYRLTAKLLDCAS